MYGSGTVWPHRDEEALKKAIAEIGPVVVAIDASANGTFHWYKGGVFNSSLCSSSQLNHAVIVVGYGSENGRDYWIIKNSWGTWGGEDGYVKIARNENNMCGVATIGSFPIVGEFSYNQFLSKET